MFQRFVLPCTRLAGCSAASVDDDPATTESAVGTCNASAQPFGGGNGTVGSPFLLCAPDQLVHLGDAPTQAHYRLARDIDVRGAPIRSITRFVGVLDGAGHAVTGLLADGTGSQGAWIGEQVRFAVETRDAFNHRDKKRWLVDNVKFTR